jgi:hypothetical protein
MSDEKKRVLELAERYVCPGRVHTLAALGVDLVIGRREGYRIWDLDGRELLDYHLNGGVYRCSSTSALRSCVSTAPTRWIILPGPIRR